MKLKFNTLIDSLDLRVAALYIPSATLTEKKEEWRRWQDLPNIFAHKDYHVKLCDDYNGLTGYWSLKKGGHHPYEFVLVHPEICDIRIWNPDKWDSMTCRQTGQIYINFRSKFLQYYGILGVEDMIRRISRFVYAFPQNVDDEQLFEYLTFIRVSRADLAADINHGGFHWEDIHNFVSRSRYREADMSGDSLPTRAYEMLKKKRDQLEGLDPSLVGSEEAPPNGITRGVLPTIVNGEGGAYLTADQLQLVMDALSGVREIDGELYRVCHTRDPKTLYFGRFSSPIYARIYNKLESLKAQNKGYMKDIWAENGWDGESGVWRVEFSVSGEFLKDAIDITIEDEETGEVLTDLRDWNKFVVAIPQIWRYCTTKWLRYCERTPGDSNRWRGTVAPWWQELVDCFETEVCVFRKKLICEYDESQLVAQIKGLALTIAARRSKTDIPNDIAYSIVTDDLAQYMLSNEFDYDFLNRRRTLGIDEGIDDTLFSIEVRRRRMQEGNGS